MKNRFLAADGRSQTFAGMCTAVLLFSVLSTASAEEQSIKDGAGRAGHGIGSVVRDIGQGAKKAGKEIGQGAKEAGKAVGGAAKEGGKAFRSAVKGEQR